MEVLNAPPYKIFRNRGVRVSLPFPFFHCFVETPLKIPLKNFRLRRAGRSRFLLFSKFSRLRRALIIIIFSKSEFFLGSYYSLKISRIFSSALIILLLRGGSYYYYFGSYSQVGIVMDCHWVQSGHNSNMGIVTQNIANNSNIGNCEVLER